jgi:5-methyltetrahydrofolate--homocysteine methyltransferase
MDRRLVDALVNMNEEEAYEIAAKMLDAGEEPLEIIELSREAMTVIGKRFEKGQYFLPELVMAGEMLMQIGAIVKPRLEMRSETGARLLGKVVVGTVEGDIHDIGKNIVTFLLDVNGFEVYDLGVDVPPEVFVERLREVEAEILGLSGFMTTVFDSMKETVEVINAAGLRDQVKIMIGGGMVDENVRKYTDADAYGKDAMTAVSLAKEWLRGD